MFRTGLLVPVGSIQVVFDAQISADGISFASAGFGWRREGSRGGGIFGVRLGVGWVLRRVKIGRYQVVVGSLEERMLLQIPIGSN